MLIHPRSVTLARFADGELEGEKGKRVAAPRAEGARCRATGAAVRALGDAARAAAAPSADDALWARIAARRVAGERMLPPADTREASRGLLTRNVAATAAAVAIIVIVAILGVEGVGVASQAGVLSFEPARPRPGATVQVRYRPASALAGEARLVLRGAYVARAPFGTYNPNASWRPQGPIVAMLDRQPDGRFMATLTLPDSAIYAEFSVFDPSEEIVDSDHGQLWALGTAAPSGRPAFNSLLAVVRGPHPTRGSARVRAAADSLVSIYPDSAQSWAAQMQAEGSSRIPHWLSVFGSRERRLAALEAALAKREVISAGEMHAMATIAAMVEDSSAADAWIRRLITTYPLDPRAIEARYWREMHVSRDSTLARLPGLDSAWSAAPDAHALLAQIGLDIALSSGDSAAIRRWLGRDLAAAPFGYLYGSSFALPDSAMRASIARNIRANLVDLSNDSPSVRPLRSTRSRDKLYRQALTASELGVLSQVMVLDHRYDAARDTLTVAIRLTDGYCGYARFYRYRATVELRLGDTAAAEHDLAVSAAAKWSGTGPFGDSAAMLLGARYRAAEWNALVDSATVAERRCSKWWATP